MAKPVKTRTQDPSIVRQRIARRGVACAVQDCPGLGPREFSDRLGSIAHGGFLLDLRGDAPVYQRETVGAGRPSRRQRPVQSNRRVRSGIVCGGARLAAKARLSSAYLDPGVADPCASEANGDTHQPHHDEPSAQTAEDSPGSAQAHRRLSLEETSENQAIAGDSRADRHFAAGRGHPVCRRSRHPSQSQDWAGLDAAGHAKKPS